MVPYKLNFILFCLSHGNKTRNSYNRTSSLTSSCFWKRNKQIKSFKNFDAGLKNAKLSSFNNLHFTLQWFSEINYNIYTLHIHLDFCQLRKIKTWKVKNVEQLPQFTFANKNISLSAMRFTIFPDPLKPLKYTQLQYFLQNLDRKFGTG